MCVICVLPQRVFLVWKRSKATRLWNWGFKFAFGRNKKGTVFGIHSRLKKLSSAVTGMADLSARLIHRDLSVITIPDGCQVDTKWIWLVLLPLSLSLFISTAFLILFVVRSPTLQASTPHSFTMLKWLTLTCPFPPYTTTILHSPVDP